MDGRAKDTLDLLAEIDRLRAEVAKHEQHARVQKLIAEGAEIERDEARADAERLLMVVLTFVDVLPYLWPNPNALNAEEVGEWRTEALDKAAEALRLHDEMKGSK